MLAVLNVRTEGLYFNVRYRYLCSDIGGLYILNYAVNSILNNNNLTSYFYDVIMFEYVSQLIN